MSVQVNELPRQELTLVAKEVDKNLLSSVKELRYQTMARIASRVLKGR